MFKSVLVHMLHTLIAFHLVKSKFFYKIEESSIHYASEEFASAGLFSCGGKTTMCQKRLYDV